MPAVVVNRCFGGFGLSHAALAAYCERAEKPDAYVYDIARDDEHLVAVVRELGAAASGGFAVLDVVEVPDDVSWHISEYDGCEHVAEDHRTW